MSDNMCLHGRIDGNCIACKEDEIIKLTGRIQSLHADLDLFAKENATLHSRVYAYQKENEKYRLGMQENCELRRHIEDYRDMNREQGNMIDDLMGFRQEYQLHVSALENEIETLKSKVYALKTDNENLKAWTDAQMKEAQEELKDLAVDIARADKRNDRLFDDLERVKKQNLFLEEKLLDAFMAGADWLEEFRFGKKLEWWADRQKAMGYALEAQAKILKEIE
jgi:predicted RNase H-like nuclease (RuvC/YqgF family)